MKALIFKRYGKADQITFADIPRPMLKPDEILVQVHAVGLGYASVGRWRTRRMAVSFESHANRRPG